MEWRLKGMFATLQKIRRPLDGWDIRSTNNLRLILNPAFLTQKNRFRFNNTIKHFNLEGNQGQNESFIISSTNFPIGAKPIFDARRFHLFLRNHANTRIRLVCPFWKLSSLSDQRLGNFKQATSRMFTKAVCFKTGVKKIPSFETLVVPTGGQINARWQLRAIVCCF